MTDPTKAPDRAKADKSVADVIADLDEMATLAKRLEARSRVFAGRLRAAAHHLRQAKADEQRPEGQSDDR